MPCRSRLAGMEVEGWGNVFIEASACARPIVVGDSGGARETVDRRGDGPAGRRQGRGSGRRRRRRAARRSGASASDGSRGASARGASARVARDRRPIGRVAAGGRLLAELHRSGAGRGVRFRHGRARPPRRRRGAARDVAPCSTKARPGAACASNRSAPDRVAEPDRNPNPNVEPDAGADADAGSAPSPRAVRGGARDARRADGTDVAVPGLRREESHRAGLCATCGASFASLMRQETVRVQRGPRARRSGVR